MARTRQAGPPHRAWSRRRRGRSSVGRAPQSHCGGQGFKSPRLHQLKHLPLLGNRPVPLVAAKSEISAVHVCATARDNRWLRFASARANTKSRYDGAGLPHISKTFPHSQGCSGLGSPDRGPSSTEMRLRLPFCEGETNRSCTILACQDRAVTAAPQDNPKRLLGENWRVS